MKKILILLVCALFGISANLAAGPAEQNPVRKINAPQILSGAQLQIAQQQPVVQGKSLKGMPIKPGSKAVAPMKALKAPARAAEATAADLTVNEAELAATVLQQNADFTAKATVYNNGTSDYQGELAVYLFTDDGTGQLVPFFATDAVSVTIPQNSSQMVSIPGHINGDEIPAGGYYIGVVADATNTLYFKDSPEYNITYIEIAADPASNYILNVTNEATAFPTTLTQDKDGTMAVTIANTGNLPFDGYIVMGLSLDGNGLYYVSDGISTSIAGQSSQQVEISYNVPGNLPSATYQISILYYINYDGSFYYVPLSDGTYYKYVEVEANPDNNYILNVADEPALPTTLNQYENGTLTVNIENTGNLAFNGGIAMALITADNTLVYATSEVPANIAGQSSQQMEIPYYISGDRITAGTYRITICDVKGTDLYYIPLSDGSYHKEIEVIETEGPALSLDEGAAFPESIMKEAEFAVSGTITNTGADFDGTIGLLLADWNGNTYYESEHQDASIARNASLPFEIKGKVGADIELPNTNLFVLYVVTGNYETIGYDFVEITPNPTIEPVLSWVTTNMPETLLQGTELTVEGTLSNTGTAFSGQLCAALISNENNIAYMTELQDVNVASNGSTPFTATGNIGTLTPGEYTLQVLHYDGNRYNIIGDCGTVTVEANPEISPVLSWVEESSDIPAFVYQGVPFTVKVMIKNDGVTFSGPVSLQISTLTALVHSAEQTVTIAEGETKEVIFSNLVMGSELSIGLYILYISTEAGELYSGIISLQDAQSALMLSVMENISEIPATIMQNQEFTLKAMVRNDGLAFDGNLRLFIQSSAAEEVFSMQRATTIASGETKEVIFTGTITDETPAGNYYLNISQWDEENGDHPLYAKDIRLIEDLSDIPILSFIEEGSNIPAILYHGREFTATAKVKNNGTDFDGTLRMHITYYGTTQRTFEQNIAIAHGETKEATFTGTVDAAIGTGDHGYGVQFDWTMDAANDDVFAEGTYDAYQKDIEISVDPTKTPILRLDEEAGNSIPSTIQLGKEFSIVVNIKNEGADYDGTIALGFYKEYFYDYLFTQPASIAHGESKEVVFSGIITYELAVTDEQYVTIDWVDGESYRSLHSFYVAIKEDPVGMDAANGQAFRIFPNPAADHVDITCPETIESIRLHSLAGTLLMAETVNADAHRLDISALPQGTYLLTIVTADGAKTERFIKK